MDEEEFNLNDLGEFSTEISMSPTHETKDVLISMIQDNKNYFPNELADLAVIKNPGVAISNFNAEDISRIRAEMAKIELLKLAQIPRWREEDMRKVLTAFSQAHIYLDSHLSLARGGYLLNKLTQISKIVSYHADTAFNRAKRRSFGFFGGGR